MLDLPQATAANPQARDTTATSPWKAGPPAPPQFPPTPILPENAAAAPRDKSPAAFRVEPARWPRFRWPRPGAAAKDRHRRIPSALLRRDWSARRGFALSSAAASR